MYDTITNAEQVLNPLFNHQVLSGERSTLALWFTLNPDHNEDYSILQKLPQALASASRPSTLPEVLSPSSCQPLIPIELSSAMYQSYHGMPHFSQEGEKEEEVEGKDESEEVDGKEEEGGQKKTIAWGSGRRRRWEDEVDIEGRGVRKDGVGNGSNVRADSEPGREGGECRHVVQDCVRDDNAMGGISVSPTLVVDGLHGSVTESQEVVEEGRQNRVKSGRNEEGDMRKEKPLMSGLKLREDESFGRSGGEICTEMEEPGGSCQKQRKETNGCVAGLSRRDIRIERLESLGLHIWNEEDEGRRYGGGMEGREVGHEGNGSNRENSCACSPVHLKWRGKKVDQEFGGLLHLLQVSWCHTPRL